MRNEKLLIEFTEYCKNKPDQRFWQALRNWANLSYLYADKGESDRGLEDTFYWENKMN